MHKTLFPATLDRYKDKVRFIYRTIPSPRFIPGPFMRGGRQLPGNAEQQTYWTTWITCTHGQEINGEDHDNAKSFAALDRIAARRPH